MTETTPQRRDDPAVGRPTADDALRTELLAALPDAPTVVMARALLLARRGRVVLGPEGRRGAGYFVVDTGRPALCQAIGRPVAALVDELLADCSDCEEILCAPETAEHLASLLPGWVARPATFHLHPAPETLGLVPGHDVRALGEADRPLLAALPAPLRAELELLVGRAPVVASFVDGRPVSFCAAAYETETWWDVSVDTLPAARRAGHGTAAAAFLIADRLTRGRKPVWGALDANAASLRMASRHGFRAIGRMTVFTPPTTPGGS